MRVSRRDFLKYCTASAAALGLGFGELQKLEAALTGDLPIPTLIWLHGSGCQGDSVSFLNLFSDNFALPGNVPPDAHPLTTADVLLKYVNLAYHTVVMSAAGQTAVTMANQAKRKGGYVLVLEGGVPTAFDGRACIIATDGGQELTYQQAITNLAPDALAVVNVGTCACFGGIPMSGPVENNPSGVVSCTDFVLNPVHLGLTEKLLINIPGCPSHPEWVAWVVVRMILYLADSASNPLPALDAYNRPQELFGNKTDPEQHDWMNIHENCPRNVNLGGGNDYATTFGQDHKCLENLGCRGPSTYSNCPSRKWHWGEKGLTSGNVADPTGEITPNAPVNWCVDCNGMCLGCVEPDFPGGDFYA